MKIADSDDASVANSLGYIYGSDRLGKPDYEKAFFWFSKAAKAGVTEARYKLADLYRNGYGTERDPDLAFEMLKDVYCQQLALIQKGAFGCKYADVALRMGYCYEDGLGCERNETKAHEYYLRAKYAIEMRRMRYECFGDHTVENRIDSALERIIAKDPDSRIEINDLPGYPGSEYSDLSPAKKCMLRKKIDELYFCDFESDDFDPEDHEVYQKLASEIMKKYSFEDFFNASFDWMKINCRTPEQFINFANLYYYYGGSDAFIANPYPFLGYLYNGIDWKNDQVNSAKAGSIFYSIAVEMLKQAEIFHGYEDEYDPFEDDRLNRERWQTF